MKKSNPNKDRTSLTVIAFVGIVAIVAIFFGFMSYGKKINSNLGIHNNADLVGKASLPLAAESENIEPQLNAEPEQPTADFPGVKTVEEQNTFT